MSKVSTMALVTAVFLALAAPAHAAIEIMKINFNPAGRDTGSGSHINEEWILLKNAGSRTIDLQGWRLRDQGGEHVYRFRLARLEPGARFELRSGRGGATVSNRGDHYFYWQQTEYVWDNNGDRATLINDTGNVVDRCRYRSAADSPKRC